MGGLEEFILRALFSPSHLVDKPMIGFMLGFEVKAERREPSGENNANSLTFHDLP